MTSYKCVHRVQYTRTLVPENIKVLFVAMWGCSYCFYGVGGFKFKLEIKLELNLFFWLGLRFVFVFKLFKTPMPFLRPVDSV